MHTPPPRAPERARSRRRNAVLLQFIGSALVLLLLLRSVDHHRTLDILTQVRPGWLLVAAVARALLLILHELRLYLALLPWKRASLPRVLGVGFTAGLVNTVLPARGGDVLAVTLLKVECGAPLAPAVVAVGLASGLEAVAFGVALLVLLIVQGPTLTAHATAIELLPHSVDLALLTAGVTAAVVVGLLVLRALFTRTQRQDEASTSSPLTRLAEGGRGLGLGGLILNVLLAAVQGFLVVAIWVALFESLSIEPRAAWLAGGLIQAAGSVLVTALPHGFAAGPAAAAVLVLGALGVDPASALAVAGLAWILHIGLAVALGAWPLWNRLGRLGGLMQGADQKQAAGDEQSVEGISPSPKLLGRRIVFSGILVLLVGIAGVGIAEIMLRTFAYQPVLPVLFADDAAMGKRVLPGLNVRHRVPGSFDTWVRSDTRGFRIPEQGTPPTCEAPSVAVLGDSFGFGMGVLEPDSFPGLLRTRLGTAGCVVNAAVPATGTCWQLARFEAVLGDLEPAVVVLETFGNDPGECGRGGIYALDEQGELGPRMARELPDMPGRELLRWLGANSHLFVLAHSRGQAAQGAPEPGPGHTVQDRPSIPSFLDQASTSDRDTFQACLVELADRVRKRGAQLVVVTLPEEGELRLRRNGMYGLVQPLAAEHGFIVVDPTDELAKANATKNVWFEEGHFDERAHAAVFRAMMQQAGDLFPPDSEVPR